MKKTFTRAAFSIFLALSLSLQTVPAFAASADEDAISALPDAQESFDDAINVIENAAPAEDILIPETDEQSLTEDFDEASSWELEDPGIYEESPVPDIYGVEEGVEEIAGFDDLVGIYEEDVSEGDVIEVPADNELPAGSELPADNEVRASLDLAEADELLDGYFEGRPALVGQGYRAENSLSGTNLIIYQKLSAQIKRVAAGEQTSTYFEVPFSALGLNQNMWTAEELGVSKLMDGNMLTQETIGAILAVAGIDLDSIANVLGTAHPYELYWFDKGVGCFISGFMYSVDGETGEPNSAGFGDSIAIPFQVAAGYAASDFEIDPATGAAVKSAMAKADEIIAAASALSDYEKLLYYKSEICDLVSYNNDVYENVDNSSVDPFQIIWVFDGDPATNVVCEGYAKAFQYLCDQTAFANDIKCITVTGVMQDGVGAGLHMWNIVSMEDGKNYLADVTNCDDGSIGEPDQLFLAGYTSGDVESGYVIKCEDGDISYAYDEYARRMYDEELVLAAKKYEKTEHVHVWSDDYTVDVPATSTEEGSESIHCTLCDAIKEGSSRVIPKLVDNDIISVSWEELSNLGRLSSTNAYYFNQLTDFEKGFYEYEKYYGLDRETFFISTVPEEVTNFTSICHHAHTALISDYPIQRMIFDRGLSVESMENNSFLISMNRCPIYSEYNFNKALVQAQAIANAIDHQADIYTKVRQLCEYREKYLSYDKYYPFSDGPISAYNDSAYGPLLKGYAVCAGLADTFKILCDLVDIPCLVVGNIGHAWNFIQMEDGRWYSLDYSINSPTLLGGNSIEYLNNSNYSLSDLFLGEPDDFVFPSLSENEYLYEGDNDDFSIEVEGTSFSEKGRGFLYTINDDQISCTITGFDGEIKEFYIPDSLEGYIVTRIGTGAFEGETGITGELIIPDSVKEISNYAFRRCSGISSIVFGKNIETIGRGAFLGCKGITGSLMLPDSLTKLDDCAFYDCSGLNGELFIPDNIELATNDTFYHCGFSSFSVNNSKYYSVYEGVLYSKDGKTLLACPSGKTGALVIKEGTVEIAEVACQSCTEIDKIVFPDSLKIINNWAFMQMRFTGDLILPDSVEKIGYSAFAREVEFPTGGILKLPASLKELGDWAFTNCGFSGELMIPDNVSNLGFKPDGEPDEYCIMFHANAFSSICVNCTNRTAIDYFKNHLYDYESILKIVHPNSTSTVLKDASCLEEGKVEINCPHCGIVEETLPKLKHELIEIEQKDPTCLEKGNVYFWKCINCNKAFRNDIDPDSEIPLSETILDLADHTWSIFYTIDKPATCVEEGLKSLHCTVCGSVKEGSSMKFDIDPDAHVWSDEYTVDRPATCSDEGSESVHCTLCGAVKEDSVRKIDIVLDAHIWSDEYTVDIPASCTNDGSESIHCTLCGIIKEGSSHKIDKIGGSHVWSDDYIVDVPATCTNDGSESIHCILCDAVKENSARKIDKIADAHVWSDDYTIDIPASCTNDGSESIHCTLCGIVKENSAREIDINPDAHVWSDGYMVDVPATCSDEGSESIHCALCGAVKEDSARKIDIIPDAHVWSDDYTIDVPATCTTDGSESIHCTLCEAVQENSARKINKIGGSHVWSDDYTVDVPATCTTDGSESIHCTLCEAVKEGSARKIDINQNAHVWSDDYTVDVHATCESAGSESFHCTLCEAINTDSVRPLEKLGHDFGEWTVTTPATEDKEGVETRTCTREGCGAAETRPIEKLTPDPSPSQDPSSPSPATSPTVSPSPAPAPAPAPAQTKSSLKKSQPMTVKVKSPTVKASKLKKKKYTFTKAKAFTIKNAKGSVTFRKAGGSKKFSISKTGKITVKKGTKKGTYKIKVIVTASGNDIYEAGEKTVTVKVKVK